MKKQTVFIKVKILIFNYIQTLILLLGMAMINIGVALLAGLAWGTIALGTALIAISLLINFDRKRGD
ncbi:hypothetical protein [Loigolactobacillus backii]|uniref:hypothetical protein n=1 Tax=Loigolactobacillus backii TaxID=375175 RepID=UPI000C1C9C88|nr:hypothetical protein [Loigolactobacillus backii]MDA5388777.1 hypothetical protein [Loigolactobacillus backii]MDA5391268.1 hypothetical protein [Loigolactobacillus backii]PIO83792.1 hypothetical protein BSQ39_09545 [Loigolactobacillus backii]